jgi:hypothetical protein
MLETLSYVAVFAIAIGFDRFLVYKFKKPTTENNYNGKFKNKVSGKNNTQNVSQTFEINPEMSNKEIRQEVRSCKASRK